MDKKHDKSKLEKMRQNPNYKKRQKKREEDQQSESKKKQKEIEEDFLSNKIQKLDINKAGVLFKILLDNDVQNMKAKPTIEPESSNAWLFWNKLGVVDVDKKTKEYGYEYEPAMSISNQLGNYTAVMCFSAFIEDFSILGENQTVKIPAKLLTEEQANKEHERQVIAREEKKAQETGIWAPDIGEETRHAVANYKVSNEIILVDCKTALFITQFKVGFIMDDKKDYVIKAIRFEDDKEFDKDVFDKFKKQVLIADGVLVEMNRQFKAYMDEKMKQITDQNKILEEKQIVKALTKPKTPIKIDPNKKYVVVAKKKPKHWSDKETLKKDGKQKENEKEEEEEQQQNDIMDTVDATKKSSKEEMDDDMDME